MDPIFVWLVCCFSSCVQNTGVWILFIIVEYVTWMCPTVVSILKTNTCNFAQSTTVYQEIYNLIYMINKFRYIHIRRAFKIKKMYICIFDLLFWLSRHVLGLILYILVSNLHPQVTVELWNDARLDTISILFELFWSDQSNKPAPNWRRKIL